MIKFKHGNILNDQAEALVNTVNCVGIMGKGIAAQFKRTFPKMFRAYEAACKRGELTPGKMFVVEIEQLGVVKYVINFPTKRHWKGKSKIEDIGSGLEALSAEITKLNIHSIAIPPLGCGLGGLRWADVKPLIVALAERHPDVSFIIYEPDKDAHKETVNTATAPRMTPGRAFMIRLMTQYFEGLLDTSITLLELHKLVYFIQASGHDLRMRFSKNLFGPYGENLGKVLEVMENHYISGYEDGGNAPGKELRLLPGAIDEAKTYLEQHPEQGNHQTFERVADLVNGFETPFGLELLSTVHWVVVHENAVSKKAAVDAIYNWNDRKRMFTERQIGLAFDVLNEKGWFAGQS